jgi:uncharacterized membrane protein
MSTPSQSQSQSTDVTGQTPRGPVRRVIATYPNYADAERAVDYLSDNRFPVDRVAIVGQGLHYVEQVTGRMNYAKAALRGAATGAITGGLVGWLFGLFNWFDPITSAFWLAIDGIWFGGILGALLGLLFHAFTGGRHDYASIGALKAERYELHVDGEVADEAARLLRTMEGGAAATPSAAAPPSSPADTGPSPAT